MKKTFLMLLAASVFVFAGCTKTGPPGPQGVQGVPGPQGNANVIGSDPFTVSSWSYSSADYAYVASFNAPDVTSAIQNTGMVQVYVQYSDGTWRNLPDIYNGTMFTFGFSTGGFDIWYSNVNGSVPSFPGTWVFRTVIVSSAFRQAQPGNDYKDYLATVKAIEDFNAANSTANNAAH